MHKSVGFACAGIGGVLVMTAFLIGATVVGAAPAAAAPTAAPSPTPIVVTASNWKFTPDTITVEAGKPATLQLTSTAGVHGLQSDDLGIPQTVISPGKNVYVTFTPKTAGTYKIYCSVVCGAGHKTQYLTVVVK
jgi:cytochrome c oxidase subunit 2